jgi:hypothetical protein
MSYTKTQVDDMMDRMLNPFRQDVAGDNSIAITANTETTFLINGNARNVASGPSYMTDRWDTSTGVMTAASEYDSPTYVGDLGFIWTPAASSEGRFLLRVYINDATPKLIRTYRGDYKGASAIPRNILATWYWGAEAGYDAKNDGIYFTIEFEHNGTITAPSVVIYNTQQET